MPAINYDSDRHSLLHQHDLPQLIVTSKIPLFRRQSVPKHRSLVCIKSGVARAGTSGFWESSLEQLSLVKGLFHAHQLLTI